MPISPGHRAIELALLTGNRVMDLAHVLNSDLLAMTFGEDDNPARPMVAAIEGDPKAPDMDRSLWHGNPWWRTTKVDSGDMNRYLTLARYRPVSGEDRRSWFYTRSKAQCESLYGFLMDDLTNELVGYLSSCGCPPTWVIETSKDNFQGVYLLDTPLTGEDLPLAGQVQRALIAKGYCDPDADGPLTRWMRLPVAINGKNGGKWQCRLVHLEPMARYTVHELVAGLGLTLDGQRDVLEVPARDISALVGDIDEVRQLVARVNVKGPRFRHRNAWLGFMGALYNAAGPEHRAEALQLAIDASMNEDEAQIAETVAVWNTLSGARHGIAELRAMAGASTAPLEEVFPLLESDEGDLSGGASANRVSAMVHRKADWIVLADAPEEPAAQPFVVQGIANEGDLGAFYGLPKAGKTFMHIDMMMACAAGQEWFGRATRPKTGFIVIANESPLLVHRRMRAAARRRGVALEDVPVAVTTRPMSMANDAAGVYLAIRDMERALKKRFGVTHCVLVMDTLARVFALNDNDVAEMNAAIGHCDTLRARGFSVWVIHHSSKGTPRRMRGSNALDGAVDFAILVEQNEVSGARSWELALSRDEEQGQSEGFRLVGVTRVHPETGEELRTAIVEPVKLNYQDKEKKPPKFNATEAISLRVLGELVDQEGIPMNNGAPKHEWPKAIHAKTWREGYLRTCGELDPREATAAKKRFERARESLVAAGHVTELLGCFHPA